MTDKHKKFYGSLAGDTYLREIRRFGLRYDEMVDTLVDVVQVHSPSSILDIGCGIGNIDGLILDKLPEAKITAIELSPEMADVSRERLAGYQGIDVICDDVLHYNATQKFDTIFSNLAIHNLPHDDKEKLLSRIKGWLKPKGVFLWGDFMDWHDKKVGQHFMDYRRSKVMESGVDKEFAEDIFAKEEKDYRLTVSETIDMLRDAGFHNPDVMWTYKFLAICSARND
jgi:tRNA (cmo5U34)-methyltransferase